MWRLFDKSCQYDGEAEAEVRDRAMDTGAGKITSIRLSYESEINIPDDRV